MATTAQINYRPAGDYLTSRYLEGSYSPSGARLDHGMLMLPVTPDNLNTLMEFDHVIHVAEDGTVTEPDGIYGPELWDGELQGDKWSLFGPYSGQQGGGSIMHNSECIGGRMASDILETPGTYVAVVCYWNETDEDEADGHDYETDGPIIEGWAVAYLND